MPPKESSYPTDWLRIAEKDLVRVQQLLGVHDPEAAGFYLQQALEKFLKAFLLSRGWRLQRVHDLELLLNESITFDPSLEPYRAVLQKVTGFYFLERYPFVVETNLTDEDIKHALVDATGLIETIKATFPT